MAEFLKSCPDIRLDLVVGNAALNLSRRDADVAIRATANPPENLVGRKVGKIAWAAYGATTQAVSAPPAASSSVAGLFASEAQWVGFGDELSGLAAASYFNAHVQQPRVVCRSDTVAGLVAGIEAGLGYGLLPCFAGDRHPSMVRLLPPLVSTSTDLWLLTHADLRNLPRIRVLIDFLGQRLATLRPLLEG